MDYFALQPLLAPLPPTPPPLHLSPPPVLVDYFAQAQAEAKIQAQYRIMDSWSSSNEPRHLPRQMLDQPVVFPVYDPTVESHGLRLLFPAPMTLSACLNDVQQQERRRLQLVRLEHERSVNKRSRSRSASSSTSHQGSNSSGSLISFATSKNLKLVIQKALKVRDVDSHGRIIFIPKKDAEDKLPYLHERVRMNIQRGMCSLVKSGKSSLDSALIMEASCMSWRTLENI